jgi:hypothetical protein
MRTLYPESGWKRKSLNGAELRDHRIQGGMAGNPAGQASSVIQKNTSVMSMSRIKPGPTIASRMFAVVIFVI